MNFPQNPRARSSSAGVLGKDKDKGKPDGDGDFNDSRYSSGERLPDRTRIERGWPCYNGLLREKWRSYNHGNMADPHHHENYVPMEPNNSEGHD